MTEDATLQVIGLNLVSETRYVEDIVGMSYDNENGNIKDVVSIKDMIEDLTEFLDGLDYPDSAFMFTAYEYESKLFSIRWDRDENSKEAGKRVANELQMMKIDELKKQEKVKVERAEYKRLNAIYGDDDVEILEEKV